MQYLLFRSLFLPRILFVHIYSLISNARNIYVERETETETEPDPFLGMNLD